MSFRRWRQERMVRRMRAVLVKHGLVRMPEPEKGWQEVWQNERRYVVLSELDDGIVEAEVAVGGYSEGKIVRVELYYNDVRGLEGAVAR